MLVRRLMAALCVLGLATTLVWAQGTQPAAPKPPAAATTAPAAATTTAVKPVATETPKPAATEPPKTAFDDFHDAVTQPVDFFSWGADLRLRQEAFDNALDLDDTGNDVNNFSRFRFRTWAKVGPFFGSRDKEIKGRGVSGVVRLCTEPRYFVEPEAPQWVWTEGLVDNAYIDAARPDDLPVSFRVGRQDLFYGNGFVIAEGTPLDGSRTAYCDAIKATLHLDNIQTDVDFLAIDNIARQVRIPVISSDSRLLSEYDTRVLGVYGVNKSVKGQEFHLYYLNKDDDPVAETYRTTRYYSAPRRIGHTGGAVAKGKVEAFDYYAEGALQYGKVTGSCTDAYQRAGGFSSEAGYTWREEDMSPRLFLGYEYLSGDDPKTTIIESWDPVLSRWPQWSELLLYRWARENGFVGYYTNLQRITAGMDLWSQSRKLHIRGTVSQLLANAHQNGTSVSPYAEDWTRGQLLTLVIEYKFNRYLAGHVWLEYFAPGNYYVPWADPAIFARAQFTLTY